MHIKWISQKEALHASPWGFFGFRRGVGILTHIGGIHGLARALAPSKKRLFVVELAFTLSPLSGAKFTRHGIILWWLF